MQRRHFIQLMAALGGASSLAGCGQPVKPVKGNMVGANAEVGHLLRKKMTAHMPAPGAEYDVVIVGGGVSGLSAARHLYLAGVKRVLLLELDKQAGGNAAYGQNAVSAYPWGAHYIPIPNNDLTALHSFLEGCGVIIGRNSDGLPTYNEAFLCFDPQERLFINGKWQDGLVPHFGVPDDEVKQIECFLALMETYRNLKGSDGKDAFAIPVANASLDPALLALDAITMKQWLLSQHFTSEHLHTYINYCCRDDFGTAHDRISAWAGIHYFAGRKGQGTNAGHSDVLTWPEGNGFLATALGKETDAEVRLNALAMQVKPIDDGVLIGCFDTTTTKQYTVKAKQCILAVPQFVAGRLLGDEKRMAQVKDALHYTPWMVANLVVNRLEDKRGAPLSWDNVIHGSHSLGYVEANHQLLQLSAGKRNLTYYWPLTDGDCAAQRKLAQQRTHAEWVKLIIDDIARVHPNIASAIDEVNVMLWGHAMAQPLPGFRQDGVRQQLASPVRNCVHFAHTDIAGISIFEEAFYQGIHAADAVVQHLFL